MKQLTKRLTTTFAVIAMAIVSSGCPDSGTTGPETSGTQTDENDHGHSHADGANPHADDHSAADHSPKHGGHIIELGHDHEYHAELADDRGAHTVTVYMMDAHMEPMTISQSTVSLTLTDDTTTATFELLASAPGGSSEFASSEQKLLDMLEKDGVKGKLRVTINGTPVSGDVSHDGHAHGDAEGEDAHAGHSHD